MKSKKKIIIPIIIAAALLLIPIPSFYKDGGTARYDAVLYSVTKYHMITYDEESGKGGFWVGTEVRVLFWVVYNDSKFVPEEYA